MELQREAGIQQLLVVKEEVPPEQPEWSSSLDQEDPEPPHIKEEQEELWTSQEGEQLHGLEEADIKFLFTPVPVKSEDYEEEPQSSQLHQRQTEDYGGPGPDADDKTGDSSEPETDDSDDWEETRKPQSGLNSLNDPVSDSKCSTGEKPFSCPECGKRFGTNADLKRHMRSHTGEKPFSCSVCGKAFIVNGHLKRHMITHTGEKPFSCSVCKKSFSQIGDLQRHMRTHSGEKPFSCSICKKFFTLSGNLQRHMIIHTGEKPFSCSVCDRRFTWPNQLRRHQFSQLHVTQSEEIREAEPPASRAAQLKR